MSEQEALMTLQSPEGALSIFDTDKAQREQFAQSVINKIIEGETSPHRVHMYVKCLEDIIKRITSNEVYKAELLSDIQQHGKAGLQTYNAEFKTKEAGVKYHYDKCDDPIRDILEVRLEETKAQLDARHEFLKTVPACGMDIIHDDEVIKVFPPYKTSTTTVEVKLK